VIEDFLRGAHLLDLAIPHDDDAVAQRHGLGLVMGNIDESGIDALPQLDDLGTHLVAQLGIQVGKRLIHQEYLGAAHNGTADGYALTLAAGKRLGLAVQVLGDIQDLGGFLYLAVDLLRVYMAQLQAEGHVVINRHMGIQRVVLEYHGDVAILGRDVVYQFVADVQLALGDFFQAGNHAQGGGLTAAGGADQNDKFLVFDIQAEIAYRGNAAGIYFVNVIKGYACHNKIPPLSRPSTQALGISAMCFYYTEKAI